MVKPREEDLEALGRLTAAAEELLGAAASLGGPASDATLRQLEQIADFKDNSVGEILCLRHILWRVSSDP